MSIKNTFTYFFTKIREKIFGPRKFNLGNNVELVVSILGNPEIFFADKRTGEKLLDTASFLDYKCVFFEFNKEVEWGAFFYFLTAVPEKITIGNINTHPILILLYLLHEIGHTNNRVDTEISTFMVRRHVLSILEIEKTREIKESNIRVLADAWYAEILSERNAWAYALRMMRKIEKTLNITLLGKNEKKMVKERIRECLYSHSRRFTGYELYYMGIREHEKAEGFLRAYLKLKPKFKP